MHCVRAIDDALHCTDFSFLHFQRPASNFQSDFPTDKEVQRGTLSVKVANNMRV